MSEATYLLTRGRHVFSERRVIEVKGKGPMATYLLRAS